MQLQDLSHGCGGHCGHQDHSRDSGDPVDNTQLAATLMELAKHPATSLRAYDLHGGTSDGYVFDASVSKLFESARGGHGSSAARRLKQREPRRGGPYLRQVR